MSTNTRSKSRRAFATLGFLALLLPTLGGCAVTSVAGAAVSVTATAVSTTADVAGAAVDTALPDADD
jgi:hypothetical protein